MRLSVVICTYNRKESLRATLDALRWQTHPEFEVVVVNGPSDDGTAELLRERGDQVRVVDCPQRILSVSRNLGIDAAAGEVVAFIDDDAVPEARWLEDLAAAYDSAAVGGAGGLTLDGSGVRPQYRYSVCSRLGVPDFDRRPPLDEFNRPRADPFLYLQGTNCSFRRSVLVEIEGFDEDIEAIFDEAEVCSRVLDAGHELRALSGAVVHHKTLPSHVRRADGLTDPCLPVKNQVHFGLRVGRGFSSQAEILASATGHVERLKDWARVTRKRGDTTDEELERFLARADEGFALGLDTGLRDGRKGRPIATADPAAFRPYPVVAPAGRRLAVCFVALDYPPRPVGGIARYSQDLAQGFAAAGHEAHVVTRHDELDERTAFEDGVWVHRIPVADRFAPELDGHPLKGNLDHLAAVRGAVCRVAERVPLDVVTGSLWIAEPLLCALDPELRVSVVCISPMTKIAEEQPAVAAAPLTTHQIRLEEALLRAPAAHLQSVSHENAAVCRAVIDRPMDIVWLGLVDRRDEHPRRRAAGDPAVEVLFVGRQEPRKGIDTLLEACVALLREHAHVRLRLCGADNPYANGRPGAFTEWVAIHAADVADRIRFAGEVSDEELFAAYADADVFCGPSRYESFGLVHVEAMMMGLPVVGCDVGGMRETIVDGETGALVPPGDVAALSAALERLIADPDLRARQGASGRARYAAEFTVSAAVARSAALFERLETGPAAAVLPATAALLADVCALEGPAAEAAATVLLDPSRYPYDPERQLRDAFLREDPDDFLVQAYEAVLGRPPEPEARLLYAGPLKDQPRTVTARDIVTSDEAIARGISAAFADRVPELDGATLAPELVAAGFLDADSDFVEELARVLFGDAVSEAVRTDLTARLAAGAPRAEVANAALATPDARRRIGAPERARVTELHPVPTVVVALADAAGDDAFVDSLYGMLLGRPPDPDGRAATVWLLQTGVERAVVAAEVGHSAEARARGVSPEVATRIARELSARTARSRGPLAAAVATLRRPGR